MDWKHVAIAKHGFAQSRDCPVQTLDPLLVCLRNLKIALYFKPNQPTIVVSSTPESLGGHTDKLR